MGEIRLTQFRLECAALDRSVLGDHERHAGPLPLHPPEGLQARLVKPALLGLSITPAPEKTSCDVLKF